MLGEWRDNSGGDATPHDETSKRWHPAIEDLFLIQRVNKAFCDTIETSNALQVLMKLKHDGIATKSARDNVNYFGERALALPLTMFAHPTKIQVPEAEAIRQRYGSDTTVFGLFVIGYGSWSSRMSDEARRKTRGSYITEEENRAMFERQTRSNASWRKMKISTKATAKSFIYLYIRFPRNDTMYITILPFEAGATLGDVYASIVKAAERPQMQYVAFESHRKIYSIFLHLY